MLPIISNCHSDLENAGLTVGDLSTRSSEAGQPLEYSRLSRDFHFRLLRRAATYRLNCKQSASRDCCQAPIRMLQSSSKINVNQPFLNVGAFEPVTDFNFYTGYGRPYQNFRGPGYYNLDTGLQKVFHITERTTFQLRGDAFNVLNSHHLNAVNSNGGGPATAFTTDIASPSFGLWNGIVTSPRNIQVSGRISF